MKHNYDEPTMQAAIDRACEETKKQYNPSSGTLMLDPELHYRSWPQEKPARLHLLKSALDFLPEPPPPVVDGKTPGQVNHDAVANGDYDTYKKWSELSERGKRDVERGASAVLAAFGNKPAEIPWTEWHGGGCPLKDEQVEEWERKYRTGKTHTGGKPSNFCWTHDTGASDIIAYRVTKWSEGFGPVDWKARAEKAEAELANWKEAAQVAKWQRDLIIDESTDKTGRILELEKLSTLRPISEAGDVPAGCVRYFFRILQCSFSIGTLEQGEDDTHFADILVLVESKIEAPTTEEFIHPGSFDPVAVTKPIHSTFTAHGKEWTRHMPGDPMPCDGEARICILDNNGNPSNERGDLYFPRTASINVWDRTSAWCYADEPSGKHTSEATITPEWTPAVGDVVTLKSGGPKMTVHQLFPEEDRVICYYFKRGILETPTFATATLTKAD